MSSIKGVKKRAAAGRSTASREGQSSRDGDRRPTIKQLQNKTPIWFEILKTKSVELCSQLPFTRTRAHVTKHKKKNPTPPSFTREPLSSSVPAPLGPTIARACGCHEHLSALAGRRRRQAMWGGGRRCCCVAAVEC